GVGTGAGGGSGWSLGQGGGVLHAPAGTTFSLSRTEREVMAVLAGCRGEAVARDILAQRLAGGDGSGFDPHRLDMLVYRLRRKCEAAGAPLGLATVRGAG